MYKEIVDPSHTCEFITIEQLDKLTKAPRSNCMLSSEKLESAGVHLPPVHERVKEVLVEYKNKL
jgi:hypothetical protein